MVVREQNTSVGQLELSNKRKKQNVIFEGYRVNFFPGKTVCVLMKRALLRCF